MMLAGRLLGRGPRVDANAAADANERGIGGICWVGIEFRNNGKEYLASPANGDFIATVNDWLVVGTAADVWVEFTQTGGTQSVWDDGPVKSVRHNLDSVACAWTISSTSGLKSITGYFTFYDAASGGRTLQTTSTVTWSANYTG